MNMLAKHSGLSFERLEFDSEEFSVDEWIQRKRQTVPLDVLRDDLGSHLKFLRSSLIELINQDYGQFVNLSSNLVGLDGKVQNIQGPLNKVKVDLQSLLDALNDTLGRLDQELEERRRLRSLKLELKCLRLASSSLDSATKAIKSIPGDVQSDADFASLSLAADELSSAKFLLQRCSPSQISQDLQAKADAISQQILDKLASLLESCVISNSNDRAVMYVLRIYSELSAENEAEEIFIKRVFKPICESVLTKKGNFAALLEETESFIRSCPVIQFTKRLTEFPWAAKYHFVGRGIFPQVVAILSKHFPHIWSPAMPDVFHSNWKRCEEFVAAVESVLPSIDHLNLFRESNAHKEFISKWQFPVYFQLRFHTFAMEVESAVDDFFAPSVSQDFKFESTRVTIKVINQCWDKERVFISHLSGRLLKASALFASRYLQTIKEKLDSRVEIPLETLINLYYDFNMAESIIIQTLVDKIESCSSAASNEMAQAFTREFGWDETRRMIEEHVVKITVEKSVSSMSSVTEVPRLFRRTNRDVPTKHSEYVDAVLGPLQSLKTSISAARIESLWDAVAKSVTEQVINRYHNQVQEVLTSVQRMEESLKRLKKVKGQVSSSSGDASSKGLSDDDKIRCQILLDVTRLSSQVKGLCSSVETSSLEKLVDANKLNFGSNNGNN